MWEINEKGSGKFHLTFSVLISTLAWDVLTGRPFYKSVIHCIY